MSANELLHKGFTVEELHQGGFSLDAIASAGEEGQRFAVPRTFDRAYASLAETLESNPTAAIVVAVLAAILVIVIGMVLYKRSHDQQPDVVAISSFTVNNAYSDSIKKHNATQNPTYNNESEENVHSNDNSDAPGESLYAIDKANALGDEAGGMYDNMPGGVMGDGFSSDPQAGGTGFSASDVGKPCIVSGVGSAVIRFVGLHAEKKEPRIGVEMNEPNKGKNNGTVNGHKYFECKDGFGRLTIPSRIKIVDGSENNEYLDVVGNDQHSSGPQAGTEVTYEMASANSPQTSMEVTYEMASPNSPQTSIEATYEMASPNGPQNGMEATYEMASPNGPQTSMEATYDMASANGPKAGMEIEFDTFDGSEFDSDASSVDV